MKESNENPPKPLTTEEARAALQPEADRLGISLDQYIEILVEGATDALLDRIEEWKREQAQGQEAGDQ